jgi:hypothetical protein
VCSLLTLGGEKRISKLARIQLGSRRLSHRPARAGKQTATILAQYRKMISASGFPSYHSLVSRPAELQPVDNLITLAI